MPDNTTEPTPLTLTERILQAGCEIINLHTGLPLELCEHLLDKSIRRASPEFGIVPFATESLSPGEKLAVARRSIEFLGEELINRGVSHATMQEVGTDLETFYRGVRGISPKGNS